jgi:signal transduction histidine kinase/HAMP domain-containing protein/DNA-binding response OmpR family regulator
MWRFTVQVVERAMLPADEISVILGALNALKRGDASVRLPVDWQGTLGRVADVFNDVVERNEHMAQELERLSRVVGKEGKLGKRGTLGDVTGFWRDSVDAVNLLIDDLVHPTSETARVIGAVAQGDLSQAMALEVDGQPLQGEFLRTAKTVNKMVDQLGSFAAEVTRVAREVGTEGKLGGQARVKGVAGIWKDLTESVNSMASNLTAQVRNIADVTTAVATGDLSKKITVDVKGEILELKNTINTMVDQLRSFASEVTRVAREVGTEGKLGGQADVQGVAGTWKDLTDSVNFMASNLTGQVRNIADVTKAVASGDLSKKITVDVKGEILELKNTINTMVDQLSSFASEVTRVAREVGTEGRLGGQADVQGVAGTWKDLTDSVNFMAGNLTSQVRGIARVVTAVANGDLQQKLTVEAKGEIAALTDTINGMIDTLATFADQVTTVAREVGVEGQLGGQAKVPGAAGTWKGLTENVNQLAANLTTQVRAIAEVATAVTQGDLTRSITVEARGEVAALKDTTNEMIRNLRDTTRKNTEQDWLKTNLAKFSRMLQGQKDLNTVCRLILTELAPVVSAQHGLFFVLDSSGEPQRLTLLASYGSRGESALGNQLELGEGLVGQCAVDKEKILLSSVPLDYIQIFSGLGAAPPQNVLILPVIFEGQVKGVIELASFERFSATHEAFLDQLTESIGIVINTIEANTRTEDLLTQSQSLAQELQSRQQELQQTNQELEEKAGLLAHQNQEVERKNQEVEQARKALEEKAEQLALTSKYKSEFLANMSHELRTPLNSLLILSDQLCKNQGGNLTPKQVEFSKTIHASGNDLLTLINDILDLSKIESGTVIVDPTDLRLEDLERYVERTFRHVAEAKNVDFFIRLDKRLPKSMFADVKRLQQVLKNLLSNAFKFTHQGHVTLTIEPVKTGWNPQNENLNRAGEVIALSVIDTGIGISPDKQQIIFEAFQQADGGTSRKYGGTGLGLAISRELSRLLGGELRLVSAPRAGSTFTLYLPLMYMPSRFVRKNAAIATSVDVPGAWGSTKEDGDPAAVRANARVEDGMARPHVTNRDGAKDVRQSSLLGSTAAVPVNEIGDDRDNLTLDSPVLLIVENDLAFARFLLDAAREKGFKGIVTSSGVSALALASEYKPSAVTLDIFLPDIDGWRVLDRLKHDTQTRHIPVAVVSTDESRQRALNTGAFAFLAKPIQSKEMIDALLDGLARFVQRPEKNLLVVMADEGSRKQLLEYLAADDVRATGAPDHGVAAAMIASGQVDCLVLDSILLEAEQPLIDDATEPAIESLSIVVYGDMGHTAQLQRWQRMAKNTVIRKARSREDVLDQTSLLLHRSPAKMPEAHRVILRELHDATEVLRNKKAMIVDDDMRNIFALSSLLEDKGMLVLSHDNGRDAINALQGQSDVDVILMDIMMPEMDGIDTIREIRRVPACKHVPIIAVTAKAMKGDREKCIEAGAWDYLSKPVDPDLMVGVLRAWLA